MNIATLSKLSEREYFIQSEKLHARRMKAESARLHSEILAKQAGAPVGPLYRASKLLAEFADTLELVDMQ